MPEDGLAEGIKEDGPVDVDGALDGDSEGAPEDGIPEDGIPEDGTPDDKVSEGVSDEVTDETPDKVPGETLGVSDAELPVLLREERPGVNVPGFPDWIGTEGVEAAAAVVTDEDELALVLADVSPTVTVIVRTLGSMVTVEILGSHVSIEPASSLAITLHHQQMQMQ